MFFLPGRFHPLTGDRAGQFALDLDHPNRLILEPNHNPIPLDILPCLKAWDSWGQAEIAAINRRLTSPNPAVDAPTARMFRAALWSRAADQSHAVQ